MNTAFHNSVFWILSINSQGVRPCWQAGLSQYKGDNCDSDQIEQISWERSSFWGIKLHKTRKWVTWKSTCLAVARPWVWSLATMVETPLVQAPDCQAHCLRAQCSLVSISLDTVSFYTAGHYNSMIPMSGAQSLPSFANITHLIPFQQDLSQLSDKSVFLIKWEVKQL